MNQRNKGRIIIMLVLTLLMNKVYGQMPYKLEAPETYYLPDLVDEISGITFLNDSLILAVDDEHGKLFQFHLKDSVVNDSIRFGENKDYEGIAIAGSFVYVLHSQGILFRFPSKMPITKTDRFSLNIRGKNEFEVLYYDDASNKLVMICKKCKEDSKTTTTAWAFNPSTYLFNEAPHFKIERSAIEKVYGKSIKRFKPSAGALHPLSGNLYIVSSINSLLVVMDNQTKTVLTVHKLDKEVFKQPEGIAFTSNGDMLISNESAGKGPATVLLFKRQQ